MITQVTKQENNKAVNLDDLEKKERITEVAIISDYGSWSISWPWPRVFFGEHYVLGLAPEGSNLYLFEMYRSYGNWHCSFVCDLGVLSEISSFDVADFGKFYTVSVFGRGSPSDIVAGTFYRDVTADVDGSTEVLSQYPSTSVPSFVTGCNFNGQLVAGGIIESLHYAGLWQNLGLGDIWWSGIGQMEFRPDYDRTAGFMSSPWTKEGEGIVRKVTKLDKVVVAYSDHGRVILNPYSTDKAVGFGKGRMDSVGIESSNHFAGDDNVHLVLSMDNELWLSQGNNLEKLGYKEFMEDMTRDNILLSYVPQKKRFYISDGVSGYCLTQFGLCSTNQLVTSAGYHEESFCGFVGDSADYYGRVETDVIDFNQRNIKTLEHFEVGGNYNDGSSGNIQTSIKYRYNYQTDTFGQTSWIDVNPRGISSRKVSAPEFKLCVRYPDYRNDIDATLDYIVARVKRSDKRNIRGQSIVGKSFT